VTPAETNASVAVVFYIHF